MKIQIELKGTPTREDLVQLKTYLEKARIPDLEKVEIPVAAEKPGQMGTGLAKVLTAILLGTQGPFGKIGDALVKWVESYRTEIILKNEKGEELLISGRIKQENMVLLVNNFFEQSRKQNKAKPKEPKELKTNKA